MNPVSVSFKGTREGLRISLGQGNWRDLVKELTLQLERPGAQSFFRGARVLLETGDHAIGVEDLEELIDLFAKHGMVLGTMLDDAQAQSRLEAMRPAAPPPPEIMLQANAQAPAKPPASPTRDAGSLTEGIQAPVSAAQTPASAPAQPGNSPVKPPNGPAVSASNPFKPLSTLAKPLMAPVKPLATPARPMTAPVKPSSASSSPASDPAPDYSPAPGPVNPLMVPPQPVMIQRTVRSGQKINHTGTVVIIGDVNAGAEVIAGGDVYVWGRLRGLVHAGAPDDNNAIVGALMLTPTQLRIGNLIARAPDEERSRQAPAEVARVRAGQIVVEPWGNT